MATATIIAQDQLRLKAKAMGGKVQRPQTSCARALSGFVCKINAVVCPK